MTVTMVETATGGEALIRKTGGINNYSPALRTAPLLSSTTWSGGSGGEWRSAVSGVLVADGTMQTYIQTATLLITCTLGGSHRPKCCANSILLTPRQPRDWVDTLREATYRSITHHLDYAGGLDGRLDRDHALWQLLQQAAVPPAEAEPDTGALVERRHDSRVAFEFHRLDKSLFECVPTLCDFKNDSVIALWRVRKSDDPTVMWIQVKLLKIKDHPTEDVYEYSAKFGLKKLNPDPLQHNSFASDKPHRFSVAKGKSLREERMDIPFRKIFSMGRLTPTSFIFDPHAGPIKGDDGWIVSPSRRPHPGVIMDAGIRGADVGPPYNPHSPFTVSGPKGLFHVIHSLPSISPPQHLDHPPHNVKGFLPSVGPVNAPPPYKMEYVYDPRYVLYYNEGPQVINRFPTQPPKQFKPSTEFVRYSEVDPFYHPHGERDMLTTTPMSFHNFQSTDFPKSINDQLPTNSPIENTKPPFQIIVGDTKSPQLTTTITPTTVDKPLSTTESPKHRLFIRPRTTTTETPASEEIITTYKPTTTKPFGEKIKPKTSSTYQTTTRTREKLTTNTLPEIKKKKISSPNTEKKNKVRNNTDPSLTETPLTSKITTNRVEIPVTDRFKNYATVPTQPFEESETTEATYESTTEESEGKTTNFKTEATEIFTDRGNDFENTEEAIDDHFTTFTTDMTTIEQSLTGSTPKRDSSKQTKKSETKSTTTDKYNDEITDANSNNTTDTSENNEMTDFLSTLTDTLFSMQTTTDKKEETTTTTSPHKTTVDNTDTDIEESRQQSYRLVTFPGDTVSIVANRISKSVSYRRADGKEGQLKTKKHTESRYRFSDAYKDYSTIL